MLPGKKRPPLGEDNRKENGTMILYVGATGIVGNAAVQELLRRGERIRCLVREGSDVSKLQHPNVELVYGDARDGDSLKRAVQGVDTIISSFATLGRKKEKRVKALWEADYEGNLSLIRHAQDAGVKKFIFLSYWGLAKFADFEHGRIKKLVEDLLVVSSMDYTILRITSLATDMSIMLGNSLKKKGYAPMLMRPHEKIRPILPEDAAVCIADSIGNPKASRRIIEVAGEEEYSFLALQDLFCRAIGKKVRFVFVPLKLAYFVASFTDAATQNQYNAKGMVSAFTGGSTCDITDMQTVFAVEQGSFAKHLEDYFRSGSTTSSPL